MKKHLTWQQTLSVTSMLFGLFFGAGNLIFPVFLGQNAGNHISAALIGFLLTGVGMPMLAVVALGITGSSGLLELAQKMGHRFGYIFTCALYLTIGPLFACPRCVTVPFEIGIRPLLDNGTNEHLYLLLFSIVFFLILLLLSLHPGRLLTWTGKIINPIFLILLSILLVTALTHTDGSFASFQPTPAYQTTAFTQGILDGYNTMDTLAGLAFGVVVVDVIQNLGIHDHAAIAINTIKAGIFSCLFMGFIYILVAIMGVQSRSYTAIGENGGQALAVISKHYFSSDGQLLLAAIVFFACLKTAVGLVTSCAATFSSMFRISYKQWVCLFCLLILLIANIGLSSIIQFSMPVLMILYPISIVLIILTMMDHHWHFDPVFTHCTLCMTGLGSILDVCRTLPFAFLKPFVHFFNLYLPFYKIGFGWLIFALLGIMMGFVHTKKASV